MCVCACVCVRVCVCVACRQQFYGAPSCPIPHHNTHAHTHTRARIHFACGLVSLDAVLQLRLAPLKLLRQAVEVWKPPEDIGQARAHLLVLCENLHNGVALADARDVKQRLFEPLLQRALALRRLAAVQEAENALRLLPAVRGGREHAQCSHCGCVQPHVLKRKKGLERERERDTHTHTHTQTNG